jgi:hypothetical protein
MLVGVGSSGRIWPLGLEVSSGSEERITEDVVHEVRRGRIQRYSGERPLQ